MVWKSKVQRNSLSAFDKLSTFSTTSMSVRIRGHPVMKQKLLYSHSTTPVSKKYSSLPLPHPEGRQFPPSLPDAASPHTTSGDGKMGTNTEKTLACSHKYNKQEISNTVNTISKTGYWFSILLSWGRLTYVPYWLDFANLLCFGCLWPVEASGW